MSIATLLGDAVRRNPYPLYTALRRVRPVLRDRTLDYWLLFDHASVQRALVDHEPRRAMNVHGPRALEVALGRT